MLGKSKVGQVFFDSSTISIRVHIFALESEGSPPVRGHRLKGQAWERILIGSSVVEREASRDC